MIWGFNAALRSLLLLGFNAQCILGGVLQLRKAQNTVLGAAFLARRAEGGAGEGDFGVVILENCRFSLKLLILCRLISVLFARQVSRPFVGELFPRVSGYKSVKYDRPSKRPDS